MKKCFYTYEEQIEKMISDGLIVSDRETVLSSLENIGYYKLIGGYKGLFLTWSVKERKKKFKEGIKFEDVKAIYDFDFELRNIIYKRVSAIETKIKSLVSYEFSEKHGIDHRVYLQKECFSAKQKNVEGINRLIDECNDVILKASNRDSGAYRAYIAQAYEKYEQVPVWALFMALTFGSVSKFYQFMNEDEKDAIASSFKVNGVELENILKIVVKFRNIVFHHERLFDAGLFKERLSPKLKVVKSLSIPKTDSGENKYGMNDFLALLIALKYLLAPVEFASLITEIDIAFDVLSKRTNKECVDAVKSKMRIAKINLKTLIKIKV